jgi:hypothetical protein
MRARLQSIAPWFKRPGVWVLIATGFIALSVKPVTTAIRKYREDDIDLLVPAFRQKIVQLLSNLRARGFDPIVFDAVRTAKEAQANAAKGTGIVDSLHLYGLAVDIIDADKGWSNPVFFKALRDEAEKLKLTSGARFSKIDWPHVQAVPVSAQKAVRALATAAARNEFVKRYA